jgi:hypothetical protein
VVAPVSKPKRRLDVRRSAYGAASHVRPLVIGDVFERQEGTKRRPLWVRSFIQLSTPIPDSKDFGKTWRWIQTDRMPTLGETVEVFRQNAWRPFPACSVTRAHGFVVAFRVVDLLGDVSLTAVNEGPLWRWPVAEPARLPPPRVAEPTTTPKPEPTIPLKNHLARLFAVRIDEAFNAMNALERMRAVRLLTVRAAHVAAENIIKQSEKLTPLQDVALDFSRNLFGASMEATDHLQKQNTATRGSILRLNDCYTQMREQLRPLVAATELRDFVKHEIVNANPARVAVWQRLLLEWERINPHAVRLARLFASKPDGIVEQCINDCYALAK